MGKDTAKPVDRAFSPCAGHEPEPTYSGALSFMRRRYTKDVSGADAVVWGIPFDTSVTNRPGCRFGPQAIRRASAILDAGDPQEPFGIDPFEALNVVDYGDAVFSSSRLWEAPAAMEAEAAGLIADGAFLLTLGGDHFCTYPVLRALRQRHGPMALIQFDAHQDTWPDDGEEVSHGNFVLRAVREGIIDPARSIQIGIRTHAPEDCGIAMLRGADLDEMGAGAIAEAILARVGAGPAYITFDIDCLDPAFAPGTGTPTAGGPSTARMLNVLSRLSGLDCVGADVMEVSPPYDHADVTAIAGAAIASTYLSLLALKKREERIA